jgi:hypothetical protein
MERKSFLRTLQCSGLALFLPGISQGSSLPVNKYKPGSFFSIRKIKGRHLLFSPDNKPFYSIGMNHIDSSALRHPENLHIWNEVFENSQEKWLQSVKHHLTMWGFNTVGWVQELVNRGYTTDRHSRNFIYDEYQWLDMPYCHMLPFANFHHWDSIHIHPDFSDQGFEDWCDYVAREHCARMANDPKLIAYFYIDCPTWLHTKSWSEWKDPLFDPEMLSTEAGRSELFAMATRYYKVTHDAIRRYDKNHLIFGDRYEAREPIVKEVLLAARPYVDAIAFQHFAPPEEIKSNLEFWHEITGMPVLVADSSPVIKSPDGIMVHNPEGYREVYEVLREVTSCIGFHLCGGYIQNRVRRKGLLDPDNQPFHDVVNGMARVNHETIAWLESIEVD